MIRVYTIGHDIPDKIKDTIETWNYWMYIVVANTSKKNKDAKEIIEKIEPDTDKILKFQTNDGLDVYVSYLLKQN